MSGKAVHFIYILLPWVLLPLFSFSQSPFRAGVFSGLAATQIDGDGYSGFDKAGFVIGGFVNNNFGSENKILQMEMLYANKGSRRPAVPEKGVLPYKILLSYIEVPVLFKYFYKKFFFAGGLSYGQLIAGSHKEYDISGEVPNPPDFHKYEIAVTGGASYFFSDRISLDFRAVRSIVPVRDYAILAQFGFFGITSSGIFGGSYNTALYYTLRYQFGKSVTKVQKEEEKEKNIINEILKIE